MSDPKKLIRRHEKLVHSQMCKVVSHVQREEGNWSLNTLMIEGCDAPFQYRRKEKYRNLKGQRVNVTYYPTTRSVAGMEMEVMNVVRVRVA